MGLLDGRSKQHNPDAIVASWDNVSDQLLRRKLLSVPLWEITNKNFFRMPKNDYVSGNEFISQIKNED